MKHKDVWSDTYREISFEINRIKLTHPSELQKLEIEPSTFSVFIAPLSAALTDTGAFLPGGNFIPKWHGVESQCVVWPQGVFGTDNGTRIKLREPLTYPEVCTALETDSKGLWTDEGGNQRRVQRYGGKIKRIFAPKVQVA